MADISDVENALCSLIEQAVYPAGTSQASITNSVVKIYRGWPVNRGLNADLASGTQTITVFSKEKSTTDTTRYQRIWRTVGTTAPTLMTTVTGNSVAFGGAGGGGQTAGISVDGVAYSWSVTAADTPATVAAELAAMIPGAVASGATVTTSGSVVTALVVGSGTAMRETRRQEQGMMVVIWCATPSGRDVLAASVDNVLSGTDWIQLADGSPGRLIYEQTIETDISENANLYRRDLVYRVEYATTQVMTGAQMLFGIGTLGGSGPVTAFGSVIAPAPLVVPPLGAIRFDAWYDPTDTIDQQCAAALSPAVYWSRLPANAVIDAGQASWQRASQATLDAEIVAALQAGLSFWAFDSFMPSDGLSLALQLYLSSSLRSRLQFCMLGQTSNWGSGGRDQPSLLRDIQMMTQPGYMTVLDGRPLYLVLDSSAAQQTGLPSGGVAAAVAFVREQVQAAGGGNPYIVWLSGAALADFSNLAAAAAAGADAAGAYATPRLNGAEQPYSALTEAARTDWVDRQQAGFPMVPTAMCGWDQRPLIQTPQPFYPIAQGVGQGGFYDTPAASEIAQHIVELVDTIISQKTACPAQIGLVYAWNELAEGGWLMPTYTALGPDTERVAAVGAALAAAVKQSRIPTIDIIT